MLFPGKVHNVSHLWYKACNFENDEASWFSTKKFKLVQTFLTVLSGSECGSTDAVQGSESQREITSDEEKFKLSLLNQRHLLWPNVLLEEFSYTYWTKYFDRSNAGLIANSVEWLYQQPFPGKTGSDSNNRRLQWYFCISFFLMEAMAMGEWFRLIN